MNKLMYCITASTLPFILITIFCAGPAYSAEIPKSWPWKGVTVNNLSFSPEELVVLKEKLPNMNSIRLTLLARQTAQRKHMAPSEAWIDMVGWTHKMLDVCLEQGIVAVISINQFPVNPAVAIKQTSPEFWKSADHRAEVIDYVEQMAKEFASRGDELIAFEVLSEPLVDVNKRPILPKEWPDLMTKIVSTIRKHSRKWIVVTPGPGGFPRGYSNFLPLKDLHIVYGAHMYEPHSYSLQGIGENRPVGPIYPGRIGWNYWDKGAIEKIFKPLRDFQQKHQVPVWIGEFSAIRWAKGSEQYLLDIISLSNSYSWGWAYFNIGGFHGWDPYYDDIYPMHGELPRKIGYSSARWKMLERVFVE